MNEPVGVCEVEYFADPNAGCVLAKLDCLGIMTAGETPHDAVKAIKLAIRFFVSNCDRKELLDRLVS